jgi:cytochrome b561
LYRYFVLLCLPITGKFDSIFAGTVFLMFGIKVVQVSDPNRIKNAGFKFVCVGHHLL